jgi:hypothetical protein
MCAGGEVPGTVYFLPQKGSDGRKAGAGGKKANCPQRQPGLN